MVDMPLRMDILNMLVIGTEGKTADILPGFHNPFDNRLQIPCRTAFPHMDMMEIDWLEMSFEACSEAPMHRDPWKSDIAVSINGCQLGVWTCPCDCGGRRGRLTPGWWPALSTQFGFLKTWRVSREGTYLDGVRLSGVTIGDLQLGQEMFIRARIEVPADAQNVGGINLFGESFGDYPQAIVVRAGYHLKPNAQQTTKNLE